MQYHAVLNKQKLTTRNTIETTKLQANSALGILQNICAK